MLFTLAPLSQVVLQLTPCLAKLSLHILVMSVVITQGSSGGHGEAGVSYTVLLP